MTRQENDGWISIHKNVKWNEMPRKVIIFLMVKKLLVENVSFLSGFVLWSLPGPVVNWNFSYKVQPTNTHCEGSQRITKINRIPTKFNASGCNLCAIPWSTTRWQKTTQNRAAEVNKGMRCWKGKQLKLLQASAENAMKPPCFKMFIALIRRLCVFVGVETSKGATWPESTLWEAFPIILGIEFRLPGLVAWAFTYLAILPAQCSYF